MKEIKTSPILPEPLTAELMKRESQERIHRIKKEFKEGFSFVYDHPASVTFWGSARVKEDNKYYKEARELAGKIVRDLGHSVTTGGGPGIMEAANRGAYEANGESLGLTIKLPHEQETNKYLTDSVEFYYFFSRKVCLSFSAEAYVFFPGGFGTLDEFFEIMTLIQTHKIEKVPVFLVGEEYWKPLDGFIKNTLLEMETINKEDSELYEICNDHNHIIERIKNIPITHGVRHKGGNKKVK